MIFAVFFMGSLPFAAVLIAGWSALSLLFGLSFPGDSQMAGVLLGSFALSQVLAAVTVGICLWSER